MARPISDEELQFKKRARRRLVGAIVLVTGVAVVLPMVLDSEPKPVNQNLDIQIPSPDSSDFKPKASAPIRVGPDTSVAKVPDGAAKGDPAAAAAVGIPDTPAVSSSQPAREQAKPQPPIASSAATDKPVKEPAKGVSRDAGSAEAGAYVVQVAALADAAKAKQLEKQMAGAGLKTYTEVVSTKSGEVTRVRAGPYATREGAEKARTQLKKVGLDGKVVPK